MSSNPEPAEDARWATFDCYGTLVDWRNGIRAELERVFGEVPAELAEVRRRGWRLVMLSNTDRDLIDASISAIGVPFDGAIVASEVGS